MANLYEQEKRITALEEERTLLLNRVDILEAVVYGGAEPPPLDAVGIVDPTTPFPEGATHEDLVAAFAAGDAALEEADESSTPPIAPQDLTQLKAEEVLAILEESGDQDPDDVRAWIEAEKAAKNRATVVRAMEKLLA